MEGGMADEVRRVVQRVENLLVPKQGNLQQAKQLRLGKVILKLLDFWPEQRVVDWLMSKNSYLGNVPPIDLVESEYATPRLLIFIEEVRQTCVRGTKKAVSHVPLREKLRGPMIDPGPPPEFPRNPNILE